MDRRVAWRWALAVLAAVVLALSVPTAVSGSPVAAPPAPTVIGNGGRPQDLDLRTVPYADQARVLAQVRPDAQDAIRRLRSQIGGQSMVRLDARTGTPAWLGRSDGYLTGRSSAGAQAVAMSYLRGHASLLGLSGADLDGLVLRRDYVDIAGTHHLSWTQAVTGTLVFGNGVQVAVSKRGEVITVQGAPIPGPTARTNTSGPAVMDATRARQTAAADLGGRPVRSRQLGFGQLVQWENRDRAELVWFLTPDGLRLAWSTYVQISPALDYQHVVDARNGQVLYRHDAVAFETGDALVYPNYPGAYQGGDQITVDLVRRGYLSPRALTLRGAYTTAWSDLDDDDAVDPGEEVAVPGRPVPQYELVRFLDAGRRCTDNYVCTWAPGEWRSWQVNREASATQGFYLTSVLHDYLQRAPFGFTAAAGNFETVDADPVLLNDLDGAASDGGGTPDLAHVNLASMSTPPDGIPPAMELHLFHRRGASNDEDPFLPAASSFDSSVVAHEFTHGLSNRLVTDVGGNSTLSSFQARSMGEGWSDYYAQDYLVAGGWEPDTSRPGEVRPRAYLRAGSSNGTMPVDCPVGSRSSDCVSTIGHVGGYTYGELGDVLAPRVVQPAGEVWSQTLWDLRGRLGHTVTGMLATRAMELSPADPSFLDERDAILQADTAVYGGSHRALIWQVFAHRGMGYHASTEGSDDGEPQEDFTVPTSSPQDLTVAATTRTR